MSLKTRAERERAETWCNTAAQTRPVLDLSSFVPLPTLPRRTCLQSASSFRAACIGCRVIAVLCSGSPYLLIKLYPLSILNQINPLLPHCFLRFVLMDSF
jgi:hypothetical protein